METIHNKTDSMVTDMIDGYVGPIQHCLRGWTGPRVSWSGMQGSGLWFWPEGEQDVSRCISAVQGSKWQMQ